MVGQHSLLGVGWGGGVFSLSLSLSLSLSDRTVLVDWT